MFRKVSVPILGIVENMSFFACPHCGTRTDIFGHGGGRTEADRLEVPFLGEIAIDPAIREGGDRGTPIVAHDPESRQSTAFLAIAGKVLEALGERGGNEDPAAGGFLSRLLKGWSAQQS
jgi:ATP-binding protein involved in chromosome partitioning